MMIERGLLFEGPPCIWCSIANLSIKTY